MPYLLFLKKQQTLKLSFAANYVALYGLNSKDTDTAAALLQMTYISCESSECWHTSHEIPNLKHFLVISCTM